jgi:NAD(P)-dependent dehydrogenase (short-subunit alcohol dehydrogenase family)
VVVGDVDERSAETVEQIEQAGGTGLFVHTDVSVAAEVEALVTRTLESFGGLHVAFSNAGVLPPAAPVAEMDEAEWDKVVSVDLKGERCRTDHTRATGRAGAPVPPASLGGRHTKVNSRTPSAARASSMRFSRM